MCFWWWMICLMFRVLVHYIILSSKSILVLSIHRHNHREMRSNNHEFKLMCIGKPKSSLTTTNEKIWIETVKLWNEKSRYGTVNCFPKNKRKKIGTRIKNKTEIWICKNCRCGFSWCHRYFTVLTKLRSNRNNTNTSIFRKLWKTTK